MKKRELIHLYLWVCKQDCSTKNNLSIIFMWSQTHGETAALVSPWAISAHWLANVGRALLPCSLIGWHWLEHGDRLAPAHNRWLCVALPRVAGRVSFGQPAHMSCLQGSTWNYSSLLRCVRLCSPTKMAFRCVHRDYNQISALRMSAIFIKIR